MIAEVYKSSGYHEVSYPASSLTAGWHHLLATFDGKYLKLYIDDKLVDTNDTGVVGTLGHANVPLMIGAEPTGSSPTAGKYFLGALDDLRIYDRALSEAEVSALVHVHRNPSLWDSSSFDAAYFHD